MSTHRTAIAIVTAALLAGCADFKEQAARPPLTATASRSNVDSMMAARGYDGIDLYKTGTGHIVATITVNGKDCLFLVDTGGGATVIDRRKQRRFNLTPTATGDYAAGIGSREALTRTRATFTICGQEVEVDDLYMMDISYVNDEFRRHRATPVHGVLGTDFLERHSAVIDYAKCRLYLRLR